MQEAKPSRTALGVALRRACHQVYDSAPLVLDDPVAVAILGETYRQALEACAASIHESFNRELRAWLVARSRYAEDKFREAVEKGVRQYVLLGAGLDTFAYRSSQSDLRVFEVDHPATQMWKRCLLDSAAIAKPKALRFVPVDFERQNLAEELKRSGVDFNAPAVFAWLGVVLYLTRPAFRSTLRLIESFPSGTGVILDYALPRGALRPDEQKARDLLATRVASAGEPFQLFFTPADMNRELAGFSVVDDLDAGKLNDIYFADREDGLSLGSRSANIVSAWL